MSASLHACAHSFIYGGLLYWHVALLVVSLHLGFFTGCPVQCDGCLCGGLSVGITGFEVFYLPGFNFRFAAPAPRSLGAQPPCATQALIICYISRGTY